MMKYINYLLVLISLNISAQEVRHKISGRILNDSIPIKNVHIINKTAKRGTISNNNGDFKILVKINDTLTFSNIQFNNKIIIIKKNHILKDSISVKLFQKNNSLKEIVVKYSRNMSKSLNLPNADKIPLNKLERRLNYYSQAPIPIVILATLLGQQGGIDDIYNIISGNRKKDRKLKYLLETDKLSEINHTIILQIRDHFQDEFFIDTLNIPKEKINVFINYCLTKQIIFLYDRKRYLEMVDIFITESKTYLNN